MKRLLICKDSEQNVIIVQQRLNETDNITYSIIDNPPAIEEVEGKIGKYSLDENGNIVVVYEDVPKTDIELLREENTQIKESNAMLNQAITELSLVVSTLMA